MSTAHNETNSFCFLPWTWNVLKVVSIQVHKTKHVWYGFRCCIYSDHVNKTKYLFTHWFPHSDNSEELHHIWMSKLPIDGSLLQKLDSVSCESDVQVCHQRLSSAFDLLLIFLIQTLTLTPPPNNALLANMDMWVLWGTGLQCLHSHFHSTSWRLPYSLVHCPKLTRTKMLRYPEKTTEREAHNYNSEILQRFGVWSYSLDLVSEDLTVLLIC